MSSKKNTKKSAPRFRVGDWVFVLYSAHKAPAQVIEDRGTFGVDARRIYRVRRFHRPEDYAGDDAFEMPEDYLEPAPPPK